MSAAALTLSCGTPAGPVARAGAPLTTADDAFGFDLVRRLVGGGSRRNVVISPAGAAMALQMAYNGAHGDTQRAMAETLHLADVSLEGLNEANDSLLADLGGPRDSVSATGPEGTGLRIANALFVRDRNAVRADFLQRATKYYRASVNGFGTGLEAVGDNVSRWVSRATHGRIAAIVRPGDVSTDTVAVVVNAAYVKCPWSVAFQKSDTAPHSFTRADGSNATVQMMRGYGGWEYLRGDGFQVVRLPCRGGRMDMEVFLPDRRNSLSGFLRNLTLGDWRRYDAALRPAEGRVRLPAFRCDYDAKLNEALAALGMGIAFDPGRADFAGIAPPPLWINVVRHDAFLKIDEHGMEAAAGTSVVLMRGMTLDLDRGFDFVADRPFFLAITDRRTSAILFMGAIYDPTAG